VRTKNLSRENLDLWEAGEETSWREERKGFAGAVREDRRSKSIWGEKKKVSENPISSVGLFQVKKGEGEDKGEEKSSEQSAREKKNRQKHAG